MNREMTSRELALLQYFYTISTDPRVRAAGYSPSQFKDAILACVSEDLGAVIKYAVRAAATKVEAPVRAATRGAAETMLGGTVSSKAAGEIASGIETVVADTFKALGRSLDKWSQGKAGNDKGKR